MHRPTHATTSPAAGIPRPLAFVTHVLAAEELRRTHQLLPPDLWCAWIGDLTRLQVNVVCLDAQNGFVGFGCHPAGTTTDRKVMYLRPAQVARRVRDGRRLTEREIADAVMWLDNLADREACLEAIDMLDRHDATLAPSREQVLRRIASLTRAHSLLADPPPNSRGDAPEKREAPPFTEPPDVFAQELSRLREQQEVTLHLVGGAE